MAQSEITGQIELLLTQFAEIFIETANIYAKFYVNKKTGTDTLSDSELLKSLKYNVENEKLSISVLSYWQYIESGRKIGAKGIPLDVLIKWIKKKRIVGRNKKTGRFITVTSLAFIFQQSIKTKGISKRPFLTEAYKESSKEFDKKLNGFIDSISKDIILKFTSK